MASVVLELQRDALEPSTALTGVLRKAMVVAGKLGISDFESWATSELTGYAQGTDIPDYRYVVGWPRVHNPLRGWIPLQFDAADEEAYLSRMPLTQGVAELESIINNSTPKGSLMLSYPTEVTREILRDSPMADAALQVPISRAVGIIESIRNIILNWSLQLEKDGITGEGISFTYEEKAAAASQNYAINNFYGSVNNPQIQQHSPGAVQIGGTVGMEVGEIMRVLELLRLARADLGAAEAEVPNRPGRSRFREAYRRGRGGSGCERVGP